MGVNQGGKTQIPSLITTKQVLIYTKRVKTEVERDAELSLLEILTGKRRKVKEITSTDKTVRITLSPKQAELYKQALSVANGYALRTHFQKKGITSITVAEELSTETQADLMGLLQTTD